MLVRRLGSFLSMAVLSHNTPHHLSIDSAGPRIHINTEFLTVLPPQFFKAPDIASFFQTINLLMTRVYVIAIASTLSYRMSIIAPADQVRAQNICYCRTTYGLACMSRTDSS
ncbi:hypothetical protein ES705_15674 [subsurface metagenome]